MKNRRVAWRSMISKVRVLTSRALTPTTHGITVEKPEDFTFRPVQFCGLEIDTADGPEEYPMSLACSPTRDHLEFGSRIGPSPWKQAFRALAPGDLVEIDGAYGDFILDEGRDAVFVAGGIGITPLKGMAEYITDRRWPGHARLVYSNKTEDEIVYRKELETLASSNPRFEIVHTLTQEPAESAWRGHRGRVDEPLLEEGAHGFSHPIWYVCGKPAMVGGIAAKLRGMGVGPERIRYELFSGYE